MIQLVSFTSAAFEAFAETYLFFSICLGKKNAEVIKFLGISKNMSPRIKYIFVQERKAMFCLIKKFFLSFTQFSFRSFTVFIHRCLCSHFILFWSLISVSKKWNTETMLTFLYSCNWQSNSTMNEKSSQE